ncbi:MAG: FtsB family cell division protein [Bacteroidales bacterium]
MIKELFQNNKDKLSFFFELKRKVMILEPMNRYLVIGLSVFLVYMTFFDEDNFIRRIKLWTEIQSLESQVSHYENEISKSQKQLERLHSDKETLEKFAREEYLMKRENEDIFLIEED